VIDHPSLLAVLRNALETDSSRVFTIFDERGKPEFPYTVSALALDAESMARRYQEAGAVRGERVVISVDTSPGFLAAFWGCFLVGAVPVPSYPPVPGANSMGGIRRLESVIRRCRPRALVSASTTRRDLDSNGMDSVTWIDPQALEPGSFHFIERATVTPESSALIQLTSGSTLDPRGCVLSHRAVCENAKAAIVEMDGCEQDSGVIWLPLYHDMGLMAGVILPMYMGRVILQSPKRFVLDPFSWLNAMARHRCGLSAAPNFAFALANRRLRVKRPVFDLTNVRLILNGAEPVDPETVREFNRLLEPSGLSPTAVRPAWGLAESTVFISQSPGGMKVDELDRRTLEEEGSALHSVGDRPATSIPSAGRPFQGAQVRIVGKNGEILPERGVGEIEVITPSLMDGYFEDPESTAKVFHDGWLRTGDLGYLAGGEVYIVGRLKDLIIFGGRNIVPQDIERCSMQVEGVRENSVIAFGQMSSGRSEEVVVLAEVHGLIDYNHVRNEIRRLCDYELGVVPAVVELFEPTALPKTSSGKVQRQLCRRLFIAGELKPIPTASEVPVGV
jgi:acyl-CoA synthetase (AMP-forming)/AMP-acid ligase II